MSHKEAELVLSTKPVHGEGPVWNDRENVLYWVDVLGCALHIFDPATGLDRQVPTGSMLGAVAPCASGGVVAALENGFAFIDVETGSVKPICDPESQIIGNRFNDGKCDPAGRFLAGSCSINCDVKGVGSLYCLDHDLKARKLIGDLTISNGMAWSGDNETFYFIDTAECEIWAFDYDLQSSEIRNRRSVVSVPRALGYLDGMTIDRDGMLWVAHWGNWNVCRWNPFTGKKLQEINLPIENVSSCTFGGPDLDQLFITTSPYGLDQRKLKEQPLAGSLFVATPGIGGLPPNEYIGKVRHIRNSS